MKHLLLAAAAATLLAGCTDTLAKVCPTLHISTAPQPIGAEETAANVYDTAQTVSRIALHNQVVDRTICRKR